MRHHFHSSCYPSKDNSQLHFELLPRNTTNIILLRQYRTNRGVQPPALAARTAMIGSGNPIRNPSNNSTKAVAWPFLSVPIPFLIGDRLYRRKVLSLEPGGKGLTQAVAASRLGAKVKVIGAVGQDEFGQRIRSELQANAVDIGAVEVLPNIKNPVTIVLSRSGGDTSFVG
ncbi:MAG: carbohydrate kinase family protein, partial [Candidatus Dormibacteraceae bacterium]